MAISSRRVGFWLGCICSIAVGFNIVIALVLFFKKRPRPAFQALILPIVAWPLLTIGYALADSYLGPFDGHKILIALPASIAIAATLSILLVSLIPWPPIPTEELTLESVEADQRNTKILSAGLLLASLGVVGLGVSAIVMAIRLYPDLAGSGSAGFIAFLVALLAGGVLLVGLFLLYLGVTGIAICVRRLTE